jgi:hypothetical protein
MWWFEKNLSTTQKLKRRTGEYYDSAREGAHRFWDGTREYLSDLHVPDGLKRAAAPVGGGMLFFALGMLTMYYFDPRMGRGRRSQCMQQLFRLGRSSGRSMYGMSRHVAGRSKGLVAEAKHLVKSETLTDRQLCERVRSELGRVVSHPGAIDVVADNGSITLHGKILKRELTGLLSCVHSVRGVDEVVNRLECHDEAGNIPELQGSGRRGG